MGNNKSKGKSHEKLDEDERYFAKVRARNEVVPQSKNRHRRKLHAKGRRETDKKTSSSRLSRGSSSVNGQSRHRHDEEAPLGLHRRSLSGNLQISIPAGAGVTLPGPLPKQNAQLKQKRTDSSGDGETRPVKRLPQSRSDRVSSHSVRPSPRSSGRNSLNVLSPAASRLASRSGSNSKLRSPSEAPNFLEEDAEDSTKNQAAFEAQLPSGMVWADVTTNGKVTCLALAKRTPLLAMGTDDGCLSVMEVFESEKYPHDHGGPAGWLVTAAANIAGDPKKRHGPTIDLTREGKVRCVDFSPDGQYLVVGGDDCTATLVKLVFRNKKIDSLKIVYEFEREDRVYAARYSPDGKIIAVGGFDGMVAIATVQNETLELVAEIPRLGLVLDVDWSPDQTLLAVGGSDKMTAIVDAAPGTTWEVVGEIQRNASVQCCRWSPDGHYLAVGGHDGTVSVVDIDSRSILTEIVRGDHEESFDDDSATGSTCRIHAIGWSPDGGAFLAVGGSDDTCAIFETQSYMMVQEIRRAGHINCVHWCSYVHNSFLAVGGDDRVVAIMKMGGHADDESSVSSSVFSTQTEWVLKDDTFVDLEEQLEAAKQPKVNAIAFSGSKVAGPSRFLAVATSIGEVKIFTVPNLSPVAIIEFPKAIRCLQFSNVGGDYLALGGDEPITYIVSINGWNVVRETAVSGRIKSLSFSHNDERLGIGSADGVLTLLDSQGDWSVVGEMDSSDSAVLAIDWSANGKYLAVGREDGTVTIHDSSSIFGNFFVAQKEFSRNKSPIQTLAFGAGGDFLATGSGDKTVAIYSAKGGWVLNHQLKVGGGVNSLGWNSNGRYLAFGGNDQSKGGRVVDTFSWDFVNELGSNESPKSGIGIGETLNCVGWSNDDRWVAFGGSGGQTRIVDAKSWDLVVSVDHDGKVKTIPKKTSKRSRTKDQTPDDEYSAGSGRSNKSNRSNRSNRSNVSNRSNRSAKSNRSTRSGRSTRTPDSRRSETKRKSNLGSTTKSILADLFVADVMNPSAPRTNARSEGLVSDLDWDKLPIVSEFSNVSVLFLEPYEDKEPPTSLRDYVPIIEMLQEHVRWIASLETNVRNPVIRLDDGKPLSAVLNILLVSTQVMRQVLESDPESIAEWWKSSANFDLSQRDIRRINAWNKGWRTVNAKGPIVEVHFLELCDQLK